MPPSTILYCVNHDLWPQAGVEIYTQNITCVCLFIVCIFSSEPMPPSTILCCVKSWPMTSSWSWDLYSENSLSMWDTNLVFVKFSKTPEILMGHKTNDLSVWRLLMRCTFGKITVHSAHSANHICQNKCTGPKVIKLFPCSTQLSTKLQLFIKNKLPTNEEIYCF